MEEPLVDIAVERRYRDVLLVVEAGGAIAGQILLGAAAVVPAEIVAAAITASLGETVWRAHVAEQSDALRESLPGRGPRPTVSAVICTRDRPDQLRHALDSLLALRSPPHEIIVVDNCPSDTRTRDLCSGYPVRYVVEPVRGVARARNRGVLEATSELVAFTDDDCRVDPRWLDRLGEAFHDPCMAAVVGYFGPRDLPSRAQFLFELDRDFFRSLAARVVDGTVVSPVSGAAGLGACGNAIFRRALLAEVGLFAEDLGPGTPAGAAEETYAFYRLLGAGYRIAVDPTRIVWHDHRSTDTELRRVLRRDSVAVSAYAARCLVRHREPEALRIWAWCLFHRFPRDLARAVTGADLRMPLRLAVAQLVGTLAGPWQLLRSRWSRRNVPPLEPPAVPAAVHPRLQIAGEHPCVSVVVPSHDRRELLAEVLDGLAAQTYPPERFEAVVVLDRTHDGSAEMLRSLAPPYRLRVVEHECGSPAASRNRGALVTTEPIVVFLDDDIVPAPGFLAAHAEGHRRARDATVVLGNSAPVVRGDRFWEHELRSWWEDHHLHKSEHGHVWTFVDLAVGNSSFPRELFLAYLLDESFRDRREDWELGARLLADRVPIAYRPDARGAHHFDVRFSTALRLRALEARSDVHLAEVHPATTRQLGLALVADALALENARVRLAYRRAAAITAAGRPLLLLLDALEELRLRRSWRLLAQTMMRESYLAGLAERLPTPEALLAFATAHEAEPRCAPVELTAPRTHAGLLGNACELSLRWHGIPVGRLAPLGAYEQWNWKAVAERMIDAASWTTHVQSALVDILGDDAGDLRRELSRAD